MELIFIIFAVPVLLAIITLLLRRALKTDDELESELLEILKKLEKDDESE